MPRPAIDRYSVAARRAACHQAVELCRAGLADAALAAERNPSDAADEALALAQRDLDAARRALEVFELAQEAASREATVEEWEQKALQVAQHRARVERLSAEIEASLQMVTDALESLAGPLAQVLAAAAERTQAAAAAVRLAGGGEALQRVTARGGLPSGTEAVTCGLIGALVRSGIGSVPGLAPFVVVDAPLATPTSTDIRHLLARDAQRLVALIDSVAPAAKAFANDTQESTDALV
jgi:hypothetical protein